MLIPLVCKSLEVSNGDSHILNISPAPILKCTYNKGIVFNWTLPTAAEIQQTKYCLWPWLNKDTPKLSHLSLVLMTLKKLKFPSSIAIFHFVGFFPLLPSYQAHISLCTSLQNDRFLKIHFKVSPELFWEHDDPRSKEARKW